MIYDLFLLIARETPELSCASCFLPQISCTLVFVEPPNTLTIQAMSLSRGVRAKIDLKQVCICILLAFSGCKVCATL